MTIYRPDRWVIIEVNSVHGKYKKILASWIGGFASADSWKLSSAIRSVSEKKEFLEFFNESGSIYICHKTAYGTSLFTESILEGFKIGLKKDQSLKVLEKYDGI